ncbi:MAG: hypothetical protein P4L41_12330 [Flavipsychrobacter sp.]|nr:hypothetical protein [Flavipsychrobacter sp.]
MKNVLLITTLICISSHSFSQKIVVDKKDEFTKHRIKQTSWEKLYMGSFKFPGQGYFRITNIDGTVYLDLKMITGSVVAIEKKQEIMFKLANDSIVSLQNPEFTVSCSGCGATGFVGSNAQGISISCVIDGPIHKQLAAIPIEKIRVYTTKGYSEYNVGKQNENVMNALALFRQE